MGDPLADPATLREIADRPTPNGLGLVLRAAADRIESAEARIAALTAESKAWEDLANGHERGAISQSQSILDLQGQLAAAEAAREELRKDRDFVVAEVERHSLQGDRDAYAKRREEDRSYQLSQCIQALQAVSSGDVYATQFARDVLREIGEQPELSR
jgi:hypothetical protein